MTTLADLQRAVQTTVASKRIGRPVFVRYTLPAPDRAPAALTRLAHMTASVRDWLGQPLVRVYGLGSLDGGQVSLTLQFREGSTALVSLTANRERPRPDGGGVDLMVLGNHGAIYHNPECLEPWSDTPAKDDQPVEAALRAVIERALRSGKPEAVSEGKP